MRIRSWLSGAGRRRAACMSATSPRPGWRRADIPFTDDLAGLSWAEQIARVQAAAREHGDELDKSQAAQALGLYAALVTCADGLIAGHTRGQVGAGRERAYAD